MTGQEDFQRHLENEYNCGELKQIMPFLPTAFTDTFLPAV